MTIFIKYQALTQLVGAQDGSRRILSLDQRKQLQLFRNQCLTEFLGVNTWLLIGETTWGKPYLVDFPTVAFNQSHSQSHYALAYTQQLKHVGVDIEDISRTPRMRALAERFFHPNELERWLDLKEDKIFWFKVWTVKEAVLKAHGLGIRLSLKTLDTAIEANESSGMIEHQLIGYFHYQCFIMSNSVLSIAYEAQKHRVNVVFQ